MIVAGNKWSFYISLTKYFLTNFSNPNNNVVEIQKIKIINFINYNGQLIDVNQPIFTIHSRPFKYGDSLFETMRMFDGQLPFFEYHFQRLIDGMQALQMNIPKHYSLAFFKKEITRLFSSEKENARIRLSVFRKPGGLYTPINNDCEFTIECSSLIDNHFEWNKKGLKIDVCPNVHLQISSLSHHKTGNSLAYILAGLYKKEHQLDDCLLLNDAGRIAEASSSNVFWITNKKIYTPPISEGGINGVMRKVLLTNSKSFGVTIKEAKLSFVKLEKAQEVFLTNSIQGLRWVRQFQELKYNNEISRQLIKMLNQKVANNVC